VKKRKKDITQEQWIKELFELASISLLLFAETMLQKENKEEEIRQESIDILQERMKDE
jgi:hypothetical protein